MRTPARTVVPTLALLAFIPTALDAQIHDRGGLVAALDSAARAHVEHAMVAGVSVAVVRGGDTLLERGYGYADLEWGIETPQDASASYEIGSITKQFTAAAIMQLVEEGKLDLDADFTDYLTDFDAQGHVVPLRRLLDHTSEIKGYTEMPGFGDLSKQDLPRDTLVSLVEAEPFEFEPGTAQIYNNSAFFFLGLIIERVSGESTSGVAGESRLPPIPISGGSWVGRGNGRMGQMWGTLALANACRPLMGRLYPHGPRSLLKRGTNGAEWDARRSADSGLRRVSSCIIPRNPDSARRYVWGRGDA